MTEKLYRDAKHQNKLRNRLHSFRNWNETRHEISNNVVSATSKASDQPAHKCSLIRAFASRLSILWLLMPRLHLPYDEYTMPVWCPNHRFRAASAGRPCDHCMDLWASWPLRFCFNSAQWQIWKNRKPIARRHIAVTSYDPARAPHGDREDIARF